MISQNALLWSVSFGYLCLFTSLCKNPLEGRKPRQPEGGILHRLRLELLYVFALLYGGLVWRFLPRIGAPAWVINLPDFFVSRALLVAAANEYCRRKELS